MQVRLLVIAKARSQLAGGISSVRVSSRPRPRRASSPSPLQVMSRKRDLAYMFAHQIDRGDALRTGTAASERHQQGRRSRSRYSEGWVSRLVVCTARASAGHCELIVSATISAMKPEWWRGEDHPVAGLAQPIAEEFVDGGMGVRQRFRQRVPQGWLLGDFFGGVLPAEVLPGGQIGKRRSVHSWFLLGLRTICVFFRNVKYRKILESLMRLPFSGFRDRNHPAEAIGDWPVKRFESAVAKMNSGF